MKISRLTLVILGLGIILQPYAKAANLSPLEQLISNEIVNMFSGNPSQSPHKNTITYTAYCINGRIVIDTHSVGDIIRQYPMSSNDVYTKAPFQDKNRAHRWAANLKYRCARRR